MDREKLIEVYFTEEIKMLLDLLPVSKFCWLCNISTRWYYTISKKMSRYEIYKKYCG